MKLLHSVPLIAIYQRILEMSPLQKLKYLANGMFLIIICRRTLEVSPLCLQNHLYIQQNMLSGETG